MANQNNTVSTYEVLIPVALVAFVLFASLAFQGTQILHDRDSMHTFLSQQDKPVEDSRKIQAQVSALALGTKRLADNGDKNAIAIIERLQKLGITVGGQPSQQPPAEAPAAQ